MKYTGKITDGNGNPIPGSMVLFKDIDNQEVTAFQTNAAGAWMLDTDFDGALLLPGMTINFVAPGYTTYGITPTALLPEFNVSLEKKVTTTVPWIIAMVLGIALLIISQKKKSGKVGKLDKEDLKLIFIAVGGIISFTIIRKILEGFGIWQSNDDKAIAKLSSDPTSFWSPQYWQTINPSNTGWHNPLDESQALALGWKLYNAMGYFSDDPDIVKGVFKSLSTKANASFVAWKFSQPDPSGFGKDLLQYLKHGKDLAPWNGLSSADIVEITTYINSLPNY